MKRLPLTEEQSALCLKYLPLAKKLARCMKNHWPHFAEDLDGAAHLALVEGAQSYDPSKGVKFATFVRYRIWGALRDVQRNQILSGFKKYVEDMPTLSSLTSQSEEEGIVLMGGPQERSVESQLASIDFIETYSRKLAKKNCQVIRLMFIYGKSQSEVAEELDCSKSRVSYLYHEALVELRHHLTRIAC